MVSYQELCKELPIQPGDWVKIPAGTRIRTTHPKGPYTCSRNYLVKVHNVYQGYDANDYLEFPARKAEVCWVGTGSYWFYADMDAVEKV